MIAYREQQRIERTRDRLLVLRRMVADATSGGTATTCLIETGILESAVADALSPDRDGWRATLAALRRTTTLAAQCLPELRAASRHAAPTNTRDADGSAAAGGHPSSAGDPADATRSLQASVEALGRLDLPSTIVVREPEGYAHYALHPASYISPTRRCLASHEPAHVTAVGLRSIGSSLASVVEATCRTQAVDARSCTVRPRGHPFDRRVHLANSMIEWLAARRDGLFIVVDEGPGLSGSSLVATATALEALDIPAERIVLMPSHDPDPQAFRSEDARNRWRRYARFAADPPAFPGPRSGHASTVREWSRGAWREDVLDDHRAWPPVHPQHERHKALLRVDGSEVVAKFTGLGTYGHVVHQRAAAVADAGFAPVVIGLANGYTLANRVAGRPLRADEADASVLESIATYLAWRHRRFEAPHGTPAEPLVAAAVHNVSEALGEEAASAAARVLARARPALDGRRAVVADARMLPHEWLLTARGPIKTDHEQHGDDHFFPGPCDPAWDVAATLVEFACATPAARGFVNAYEARSHDRGARAVLGTWLVLYLAARVGYVTFAGTALAGSPEAARFQRERARYAARLARELARTT